jgi:hypothetical protein
LKKLFKLSSILEKINIYTTENNANANDSKTQIEQIKKCISKILKLKTLRHIDRDYLTYKSYLLELIEFFKEDSKNNNLVIIIDLYTKTTYICKKFTELLSSYI